MRKLIDEFGSFTYPGRLILQGLTYDRNLIIQAYLVTSRSESNRRRHIAIADKKIVITRDHCAPFLSEYANNELHYTAMDLKNNSMVCGNGPQVEKIQGFHCDAISAEVVISSMSNTANRAVSSPMILGVITYSSNPLSGMRVNIKYGLAKPLGSNLSSYYWEYSIQEGGVGFLLSTYDPYYWSAKPFKGEPIGVLLNLPSEKIPDDIWQSIHSEIRVGLAVRIFDLSKQQITDHLFNNDQSGGTIYLKRTFYWAQVSGSPLW